MLETTLHRKREAHVMARRNALARRRSALLSKYDWRHKQVKKIRAAEQVFTSHKIAEAPPVAVTQQVKKPALSSRVKNALKNIFHGARGH